MGLVGPIATLVHLFGSSVYVLTAFPFVCSLLTVWVSYSVGRRLAGEQVGMWSAGLMAVFPLELIFASHVFPCTQHALAAGTTLLCVLQFADRGTKRWLLLAGLALGAGYLARATALFCIGPVLFALWVWSGNADTPMRRRIRQWLLYGLAFFSGLFLILASELVFYSVFSGDPFYRFGALATAAANQGKVDVSGAWITLGWWLRPFARLLFEQELGVFPLLSALSAGILCRHRDREANTAVLVLVVWVGFVFLYTYYGSVSPFRLAALPRLPRYLATLSVPAIVLIAMMLERLTPPARRQLAVFIVLSSLVCVALDGGHTKFSHHKQLHDYLAHVSEPVVLTRDMAFPSLVVNGCGYQRWIWSPKTEDGHYRPTLLERICPEVGRLSSSSELQQTGRRGVLFATGVGDAPQLPVLLAKSLPTERFTAPRGLYHALLDDPLFLCLLSLTRDEYRMNELRREARRPPAELVVFQLPR